MATYNGAQYTDFQNVNLKGSGTGANSTSVGFPNTPGALRIKFQGFVTTVSISGTTQDQPFAITLPNKSGTLPISGTFSVDLPVIASSGYLSTVVTVTGIRTEDGLNVSQQSFGVNGNLSARGAAVVAEAIPGNGSITLTFVNAFATATIARTSVMAYTAVR